MDVADLRLCLLLHSLSHLNDRTLCRLLLHFGGPCELWHSDHRSWKALGLSAAASNELRRLRSEPASCAVDVEAQLDAIAGVDACVLPISDNRYPALLRTIYDPPPFLYLRGELSVLQQPALAVVGSRRGSSLGLRAAQTLSAAAVGAGLHIVSGLALGVDGAAHRGALGAGGVAIAVMATGIDLIYPARHRELALQVLERGCLLTEFPPGVQPLRYNFPRRNRIISGISLGVLVVEAALPSGSLITAGTALEQGREVFALPWSPYHPGGAGCLRLLRDGAKMVQDIDDIVDELGSLCRLQEDLFTPVAKPSGEPAEEPDGPEGLIFQLLGMEAVTVDELAMHSDLPVSQVLSGLSTLEMTGRVSRCAGGYIRS